MSLLNVTFLNISRLVCFSSCYRRSVLKSLEVDDILQMEITNLQKIKLIADKTINLVEDANVLFINKIEGLEMKNIYSKNLDLMNTQKYKNILCIPILSNNVIQGNIGIGNAINMKQPEEFDRILKILGNLIRELG